MKLVLKNVFAWDGLYWIYDEAGVEKYYVDARVGDGGRYIYVSDASKKEIGAIRQKALSLKKEYVISRGNEREGGITRNPVLYDYEYLASYRDWMVSGDVYGWNFRIVYPKGDIATSICVDGGLGLEIIEEKFENHCALLMMALAGLQDDLKKETEARERGESTSIAANLLKAGKNAAVKACNAMDEHFEKNREKVAEKEAAARAAEIPVEEAAETPAESKPEPAPDALPEMVPEAEPEKVTEELPEMIPDSAN